MAAYTRSILEPLVARLAEQEVIIRGQAETVGSLRAQLAAAEARIHSLEALQSPIASNLRAHGPEPNPEPSEPPRRPEPSAPAPIPPQPNGHTAWWRRWPWDGPLWLLLTALLLLILVAVALWAALEAQTFARLA
jgi:hypothetical protein